MRFLPEQRDAETAAGRLVILVILFVVDKWIWAGILFLAGIGSIAEWWSAGQGWYPLWVGLLTFGLGVWALTGYYLPVLHAVLAFSRLVPAFVKPPVRDGKTRADDSFADGL